MRAARAHITLALVAALQSLRAQIQAVEDQIAEQFLAHPDAAIFTSLPKSGTVRAARLLAEIRPTPRTTTPPTPGGLTQGQSCRFPRAGRRGRPARRRSR